MSQRQDQFEEQLNGQNPPVKLRVVNLRKTRPRKLYFLYGKQPHFSQKANSENLLVTSLGRVNFSQEKMVTAGLQKDKLHWIEHY